MNADIFTRCEKVLQDADGNSYSFILRPFAPGDEYGLMECVKDEYKDTYFKRDFYDPEKIRTNAAGDRYCYFVAEHEGEIAGMVIFAIFHDDEDDYIEPASNIIRRKYRDFGLAHAIVYYALPLAEKLEPCSLFVHAVTFHTATQALCEGYGMIPVGFRLGSFLASRMSNSYDSSRCTKYSEGVMILPVRKKDAGTVYLPEEIVGYGRKIYERLGADCNIVSAGSEGVSGLYDDMAEFPELVITADHMQRIVIIRVMKSGRRIADQMREQIAAVSFESDWTIQIALSISSPNIYYEYEELKKIGFFFSGLKPLCGAKEKLYMQWVGDLRLDMEKYMLTESFDELRRDIEEFYSARRIS